MALLDRYLTAVAFWLPAKEGGDVTAELRDDIRSEIEAREASLGRPLDDTEVEAILTRLGHPMRVAERYLPQRSLIGPALLPVYLTGLKVLGTVAAVWLAVIATVAAFEPSWVDGDQIAGALDQLVTLALFAFAILTLVFAAAERWTARATSFETWTARALSDRPDPRRISRPGAAVELVFGVAVLAWLSELGPASYTWTIGDRAIITWSPIIPALYWATVAIMAASVAMSLANLTMPRWTIQRLGLQMAIDSIALVIVLLLMPVPALSVTPLAGNPDTIARLTTTVNATWVLSLAVVACIIVVALFESYRRLAPPRTSRV